jgi:glycosyltransferase involved in cell wall biosynthesis
MTTSPAVSIITLTYNHERFLRDCLDSVLAQTAGAWEQIVLDDGSTDATAEIAARYRDPRIRYVRQGNQGILHLARSYNTALGLCRAPLVAILEGDDWWPPDKLEALVPAFDDPEVVLAFGRTSVAREVRASTIPTIPAPGCRAALDETVLENRPVGRAALAMLDGRCLTFTYPCSVVVRRASLERIGGFQERPELPLTDYPTFLRLTLEGRFHYVHRTMGYWRVHHLGTTLGQREAIWRGVHREAAAFRRAYGARLPITPAEWDRLERGWHRILGYLSLQTARRLLVSGRSADARFHLHHALRHGWPRPRLGAMLALVASYAGGSIEPLYRAAGHPWYRRGASGAPEYVVPAPRRAAWSTGARQVSP